MPCPGFLYWRQAFILLAQIEKAINDSSELSRDLYTLLEECETDIERSAIHYALWQIEGDFKQAQRALAIYQSIVKKTPAALYLKRLRELLALSLKKPQL